MITILLVWLALGGLSVVVFDEELEFPDPLKLAMIGPLGILGLLVFWIGGYAAMDLIVYQIDRGIITVADGKIVPEPASE